MVSQDMSFLFRDDWTTTFFSPAIEIIARVLDDAEIGKIRDNNIWLVMTVAPGNTLSNFRLTGLKGNEACHLITIDKTISDFCRFDSSDRAGLIMHEFGHILNDPPTDDRARIEFYADYYAKKWKLQSNLSRCHEKYLASKLPFVSSEIEGSIRDRISELKNPHQNALVGRIKRLR